MIIDDRPGLMPCIEHLWAFLSIDKDGDEGVCAAKMGDMWVPLVAADEKRVETLREYAQRLVEATGCPIRLVKFTVRQEIEVIGP
jgi:hypothetical protein